ncbi:MAG: MFS transporter [Spirochaetales bacterium]|nr:MFS transporter [Spirochaetales bacterium]
MFLSRAKKLTGQKNYITYTFINGLGYSFMAETIIYLLALYFGAGNMALGYISSAVYLTGVVIFFVPRLFPGVRIIGLFFAAWMLRGIICLAYGLTPFVPEDMAVALIVLIYTLYCLLRNTAYPLNPIIQGIITKPSERGHFSARVVFFLYASMTLSRLVSFGVLSFPALDELEGILLLIGLGVLLNTAASFAVRRVPVEDRIERRNLRESLASFARYLRTPQDLIFILLYCGGMSLIVLFNFSIPFLRKTALIPSNLIFIFTTVNFLGVMISSRLIRPFLDRFGSRPILILVNLVIIGLSLFWFRAKGDAPFWSFIILGFVSLFFIGMIRLLLDRLIVNRIPENDRIGFTSAISVVFSFVSLGIGLAGGALADSAPSLNLPHEYSLTFALMGVLALANFFLSLFLKEGGSLSANQFLTTMMNPRSLRTIRNIDLLKKVGSGARKESILIELESDQSHLATQEIRRRLNQATLRDKEMVIRSLFSCPRPELEKELIEEALDRNSWWRQSAVFALGAYPTEASRIALRKIVRDKYPYIASVAAKSMARIGDFSCHGIIKELLERDRLDVRTCLNLVIALSLIEKDGRYWSTVFRLACEKSSHRFIQSLMIIGSTRQNYQPPMEDLFLELNQSEQGGFETLMEEMADLSWEEGEFEQLMDHIRDRSWYALWSWCRNRCRPMKLLEPHEHLRESIVAVKKRNLTPSLVLAGLYFTMQLEKIREATRDSRKHKPE